MSGIFYIPAGPKNIQSIFTNVDFSNIDTYFIEVIDETDTVIATTKKTIIQASSEDMLRVHFINYLGTVDAVNFLRLTVDHESKSFQTQLPLSSPLKKSVHSTKRFGIKSNDTYKAVCRDYDESTIAWLDELLDSPLAWIEWTGTQGQPDSYLPIVIEDGRSAKVQEEDRFRYDVLITFKLSNERILLRN